MPAATDIALKEWAVLCAALASGRQTLLLRKGGILDRARGGEFEIEQRAFLLFPTYFHEKPGDLVPEARPLLDEVVAAAPPPSEVHLGAYATVYEARWVPDLEPLLGLAGTHLYSEECVRARYAYRRPGMWVIVVRVHALPVVHVVRNTEQYAGCVSWVRLEAPLSVAGARPVLDDAEFEGRVEAIRAALV